MHIRGSSQFSEEVSTIWPSEISAQLLQGTQIIKLVTHPAYQGYGKDKKNTFQVSKYPLVHPPKSLIRVVGQTEF